MFEQLTKLEELLFSTIRIECDNGKSIGTGFFFGVETSAGTVLMVITNTHVVAGQSTATFHLTLRDENDIPVMGKHIPVTLNNLGTFLMPHPEPEVDLCAISVTTMVNEIDKASLRVFLRYIDASCIPSQEQLESLDAIEEVLMIGYPRGFWDEQNNMPMVRRGITATHPALDFRGRPHQLIDIAMFNGSSGSPVIIYQAGVQQTRTSVVRRLAPRVLLVGVAFGSMIYNALGSVTMVDVPTVVKPQIETEMHTNLGVIIKARKLMDFVELVTRQIELRAAS